VWLSDDDLDFLTHAQQLDRLADTERRRSNIGAKNWEITRMSSGRFFRVHGAHARW
jgi:hypothetical protein